MNARSILLSTIALFGGLAPLAHGAVIVLNESTRGWETATVSSPVGPGGNYRAGFCPAPPQGCNSGGTEFRDFFTFAIPQLNGPILSAALVLSSAGVSTVDSPTETYQITSIPSVFGFTDLGTGTVYGSRVYTQADGANSPAVPQGTTQSIALDAAGIAAIQSNTTFGIGGRITTLGPNPTNEMIFDSSGIGVCPACITELQIVTADTPEPGSYGLMAAGFAALLALSALLGGRRNRLRTVVVGKLVRVESVSACGRIER